MREARAGISHQNMSMDKTESAWASNTMRPIPSEYMRTFRLPFPIAVKLDLLLLERDLLLLERDLPLLERDLLLLERDLPLPERDLLLLERDLPLREHCHCHLQTQLPPVRGLPRRRCAAWRRCNVWLPVIIRA